MSQPKPAAIFDHCQHCGVITVWQYRVDNQDTGAKGGDYRCRTASVAASQPMKLPNVSPRLSPTLTIMNRTRRSIVEMDLRPVIGRVGIDSWRLCSLLGVVAHAALGVSGDAGAGRVRGQLVATDVAVLRQLRKWGRFGRW